MPPRRSARLSQPAAVSTSKASSTSELTSDSEADSVAPSPSSRRPPKTGSSKPKAKATPAAKSKASKKTLILSSSEESDSDSDLISPPPKRRIPKAASSNPATKVKVKKDLDSDAGSDYEPDSPRQRKSGNTKPNPISSSDAESDFEPVSPAAKRRRTRASLESADTERGGPAAVEVYSTLEIFQSVLARLDNATLAGMLRLEKRVTAAVAAVLYKTIHVSQTSRMSRGSPRRVIYCDAVRVLDISPLPTVDTDKYTSSYYYQQRRSSFHPDLIKALPSWQRKLPNLLSILRDRPLHPSIDDAFIVHLGADQITVDVDTPHRMKVVAFPAVGSPDLPSAPSHAGFNIRHTISLTVSGGYQTSYDPHTYKPIHSPAATLGAWRSWLFCDPTLDSRVSSVSVDDTLIKLSAGEVISFAARRAANLTPIRSFTFPSVKSFTMAQLRRVADLLGPSVQTLKICSSVLIAVNDWHGVINVIDTAFPSLHTLLITENRKAYGSTPIPFSILSSSPPSGLPELQEFRFNASEADNKDQLALARSIYRLGGPRCTYYTYEHHGEKGTRAFNDLVTKLKSPRARYASLHTLQAKDLDLNGASGLTGLSFEPTRGHFRRVAWTNTSTYATELSNQQGKLEALVTEQKSAVVSYQQVLARTTDGLQEVGGDTKAENKVLKREFEKVLKDQAKLASACKAMKKAASDMEAKSRNLMYYANRWLKENKEDGEGAKGK